MRGALVAVLLVACAPSHTTFPAPAPDLTPDQRVDMFNKHVAEKEHWISQNGAVVEHSVIMQDGTEVYYPEDLVPLVGEDSATAQHAHKAVRARTSQQRWTLIGAGLLVAGAVLVFKTFDNQNGLTDVGWAALLGGLVAYGGFGTYYRFKTTSETHAAYGAYDDDLAHHLNVCIAALQIVPCEAVPQQGAPQPAAPKQEGYYPGQPVEKH